MSAVGAVLRAETRIAWRDGRLPALLALTLALGSFSAWASATSLARLEAERAAAQAADYATWLSQRDGNPHSFAHFGLMAFKPASALQAFDPGVTAQLGASIWLEAHWQDPANHRAAEDALDAARWISLDPAWALQTLGPLVVIALGYATFARERESGAWRMTLASGASPAQILAAKAGAVALLSCLALAPLAVGGGVAVLASSAPRPPDFAMRTALLAVLQLVYLAGFVGLTVAVSSWARTARSAFAWLAAVWAVAVIAGPRIAVAAADRAWPAPSAALHWAEIDAALRNGLDGHDPADERARAFERRVLAQYGVARKEDLPVSFAGLSLAESETHGNDVFDAHYARLWGAYARQRETARAFSLASPAIAVREASQWLAGADERHHRHFADSAESHRRTVVKILNDDLIRNGAGRDFDYRAPRALWATIPPFSYGPPALTQVPASAVVATGFGACALWLVASVGLAVAGVRRWSRA